jgi:hypothetical protein
VNFACESSRTKGARSGKQKAARETEPGAPSSVLGPNSVFHRHKSSLLNVVVMLYDTRASDLLETKYRAQKCARHFKEFRPLFVSFVCFCLTLKSLQKLTKATKNKSQVPRILA